MKNNVKADILMNALSLKGVIITFILLFAVFYVIYRNILPVENILGKSAFATCVVILMSVLAATVDKLIKSGKKNALDFDIKSIDSLSDEEYETLREAIVTRGNAVRAAIYFYGLSLTLSIIGLYDAGIVKIILASLLCFTMFVLLFGSRLLYIRIRYGTWIAPRRK